MKRTHTCGELRKENEGQEVCLAGWLHNRRDLGGLVFLDLRDRYGLTQLAIDPSLNPATAKALEGLHHESVIEVKGTVALRPDGMANSEMATGEVEVKVLELSVLSRSSVLPFEINNEESASQVKEALRLEYRFLDLRRPSLQAMLKLKDDLFTHIRAYFKKHDFVEVQTPILANSSPEGARDFLIPSRLYPGSYYALPQAPQQFKQLLMVSGVDRYFQIAPCFRDEDTRNDRHYGEFYQVDMEMSFVEQEDVFVIMEPLMKEVTEKFSQKKMNNLLPDGSFLRLAWREAMDKYGTDKPDLRYELEIIDLTKKDYWSLFPPFAKTLPEGVVRGLRVPGGAALSRKQLDGYKEVINKHGVETLAIVGMTEEGATSSLSKFLSQENLDDLAKEAELKVGDALFLTAGVWKKICAAMGNLRTTLAKDLNFIRQNEAAWCWITDFPMYDASDTTASGIDFSHNPFSMPQGGHEAIDNKDPLDILAYQYDLVLNGYEISSGGVRNHDSELLRKVFIKAGYEGEEVDRRFGALIKAFQYGAPPHAGNAPGVDRLLMVLTDNDSIRDMYAFPKDGQGRDLLMNSPSPVDKSLLDELNLEEKKVKDK